jgi:hypothetical protein
VKAGHNVAVLNVREAAEVKDKVRTAVFCGDLVTGFLDITIGEAEGLPNVT